MTYDSYVLYYVIMPPARKSAPAINWGVCECFWIDLMLLHNDYVGGFRHGMQGGVVTMWSIDHF